MTEADVADVLRQSVMVILKLAGPPLIAALVVGVVFALIQAVTQINEAAMAFVPKMLAVFATFAVLGSFMNETLVQYARVLFDRLVTLGGQ